MIRKFTLGGGNTTISKDAFVSQLELIENEKVASYSSGHLSVAHINSTSDIVSACTKVKTESNNEYLYIWSVKTENDATIASDANHSLNAETDYRECLAMHAHSDGYARAFVRGFDDGRNYIFKLTPSSTTYKKIQQDSTRINFSIYETHVEPTLMLLIRYWK